MAGVGTLCWPCPGSAVPSPLLEVALRKGCVRGLACPLHQRPAALAPGSQTVNTAPSPLLTPYISLGLSPERPAGGVEAPLSPSLDRSQDKTGSYDLYLTLLFAAAPEMANRGDSGPGRVRTGAGTDRGAVLRLLPPPESGSGGRPKPLAFRAPAEWGSGTGVGAPSVLTPPPPSPRSGGAPPPGRPTWTRPLPPPPLPPPRGSRCPRSRYAGGAGRRGAAGPGGPRAGVRAGAGRSSRHAPGPPCAWPPAPPRAALRLWLSCVCFALVQADSPSAPVNVTVRHLKANSAVVSWDVLEDEVIIGFAISQQKKDVRMLRFIQEVNTTTRSCALWDLEEDTEYIVHVQAISIQGQSPASEPLLFKTPREAEKMASKNKDEVTMKEMGRNQQLRTGEVLIIVVVLFMWAGVIALFCRQYDIIKDNEPNNNKEKTKSASETSTPEHQGGGLLRSKI
ncbi:fibronectin type III domain-containing protein 5 [Peromyscus leucopus]|uniref:fibronectin type III domain-containing protein 5 n=2 Tax=Cricetidae TaxID=337677 RepID=UPI0018850212|nr:fibronectin type III domain-containing protein 5 [Peromyscus leucopus]